jgi:hypothetical protein
MYILNNAVNEQRKYVQPSHLPNSYEKFIERLKTYDVCYLIDKLNLTGRLLNFNFKISKWFAKPSIFSPISCSKHGWTNYSTDTLKCVSCSKTLYIHSCNLAKVNCK